MMVGRKAGVFGKDAAVNKRATSAVGGLGQEGAEIDGGRCRRLGHLPNGVIFGGLGFGGFATEKIGCLPLDVVGGDQAGFYRLLEASIAHKLLQYFGHLFAIEFLTDQSH